MQLTNIECVKQKHDRYSKNQENVTKKYDRVCPQSIKAMKVRIEVIHNSPLKLSTFFPGFPLILHLIVSSPYTSNF